MKAETRVECLCGNADFEVFARFDVPPPGEKPFGFGGQRYHREVRRCRQCGHYRNVHEMDMTGLYEAGYVDVTYGGDGLRRAFERIVALDPAKSDNAGRVEELIRFASKHFPRPSEHTILDVGSGLCVFLHRVRARTDWICTALDPDRRAVIHARETVNVSAVCGDFMLLTDLGHFDIVTFNKVLEHVRDPVAMLAKGVTHLNPGGFVYIELPDGDGAAAEGPQRQEFFVEHHHVFSRGSVVVLAERAGFEPRRVETLREPSGKFTHRAFLVAGAGPRKTS